MLDRYWDGDMGNIASEAPVPVVKIKCQHESLGGDGNVALNIRLLGAAVSLLGIVGDDQAASTIAAKLRKATIKNIFQRERGVQTPIKLRVISRNQQLLRVDSEKKYHQLNKDKLVKKFNEALKKANLIVLSDYAKGTLSDPQTLISLANEAKIPVLVDPKGQDFSRYRGASILTPNRKEFEAIAGPCANDAQLVEKGEDLLACYQLGALLITRGECGMTLLRSKQPAIHLPAESREVYDVTGAGDTVIALLASALAVGASLEASMKLANAAAGIVVSRLGTTGVTVTELRDYLQRAETDKTGILTSEQLALRLAKAGVNGQRIAMVYGYFDILHSGVVDFLRYAKGLADLLLVAVEDDATALVDQPLINTLQRRLMVLQALEAVDWVIPYPKETLDHLIREISPHVILREGEGSKQC